MKKKYDNIDFKNKQIQKYFIINSIKENSNLDNPSLKQKFKDIAKFELPIKSTEISKLRSKITYKTLNI